jgi:hypothetical protein
MRTNVSRETFGECVPKNRRNQENPPAGLLFGADQEQAQVTVTAGRVRQRRSQSTAQGENPLYFAC